MASTFGPAGTAGVVTSPPTPGQVRIVLLGLPCRATVAALIALVTAGAAPVGVVLADQGSSAGSMPFPPPLPGLPTYTIGRFDAEARALIADLAPDVLVTACFPWRVPAAVRRLAPAGGLNIHPSLLPWGRGPNPVFWTFRQPAAVPGVTVHVLDDGFDTGPIIAQQRYPGAIEGRASMLELDLMAIGAALLAQSLPAWLAGTLSPVPQPEAGVPAPRPTAADLVVSTSDPAAWVYRFAHGVSPEHSPLTMVEAATGRQWPVADALAWGEDAPAADPPGTIRLPFAGGWVSFALAPAAGDISAASGPHLSGSGYPLSLSSLRAKVKR